MGVNARVGSSPTIRTQNATTLVTDEGCCVSRPDFKSDALDEDTVPTSTWSAFPAGLMIDSPSATHGATVWISGGILGTDYLVTTTIASDGGLVLPQSFPLQMVEKHLVTS